MSPLRGQIDVTPEKMAKLKAAFDAATVSSARTTEAFTALGRAIQRRYPGARMMVSRGRPLWERWADHHPDRLRVDGREYHRRQQARRHRRH